MNKYKIGDILVDMGTCDLEKVVKIENNIIYALNKRRNFVFKYGSRSDYANDISGIELIRKYTNIFKYLYCDLIGQYS